MRRICESRDFVSFLVAAVTVVAARYWLPFPKDAPVLELIGAERPHIFSAFKAIYVALSFTSPYSVTPTVLSLVYIFIVRRDGGAIRGRLPRFVDPAEREELYLVVGDIHHPKKPVPVEHPHWRTIPRRGLFTGLAIFSSTRTGKTSCCMVPFADQILAFQTSDPERRISGLVLEVKGDFCHKVNEILTRHGRAE